MVQSRKYAVIGTGAIGGYYGARLARAGFDVSFLFHRDYEFVRENGLQVDSVAGSFLLRPVKAFDSTAGMGPCDVVLVALKTVNNHLLKTLLPQLLKPDTLVVLIQNGIGVEEDVQREFPGLALAAGLAFICCAKTEPGRVDHQCYGSINIGNYSCRDAGRIAALVSDLRTAGIEAHEVEYQEARWKKAVWNMPFNGMTVLLAAQTDSLLRQPDTRQLIYEQMLEIVRTADRLGVRHVDAHFADRMIETTLEMTPYSPSMKLDFEFGRPMEIYYLYTRPLEIARQAGTPMPKLEMLETGLKFLAQRRGEGRSTE